MRNFIAVFFTTDQEQLYCVQILNFKRQRKFPKGPEVLGVLGVPGLSPNFLPCLSCAAKSLVMKCFDAEKHSSKGSSKHFQPFCFNQTMKHFIYLDRMYPLQEHSGSLSYILCFTIYISLHDNPKYTLRKVIVYHYRLLSSKVYQNRYQVIGIGPGVPGSICWVVDLEVLGPGSWVLILEYANV